MNSRAFLLFLLLAGTASAQAVDATHWPSGRVDLSSGWREHDGDNPAWAQPHFDDSRWQAVELDDLGAAQPGWRWYRLQVKLARGHPHLHLLIEGADGAYAAYINGQLADGPRLSSALAVRRPTEEVLSLDDGGDDLEIALRTCTPPHYAAWHLPLFLMASLGTPGAIDNERAALASERLYAALPSLAVNLLLILAGMGALALYRSQRTHNEYLWLGLYLFLLGFSNILASCQQTGIWPNSVNFLAGIPLIYAFTIMQIQFTFSFVNQRMGRFWRGYEILLCAGPVLCVLTWYGKLSSDFYEVIEALAIFPGAVVLTVLLFLWYRRGNREAGWLIVPSIMPAAATALYDVGTASIFLNWQRADFLVDPIQLGPVPIQIADVGDLLFLLAIAVVMFFRFTRVSREQARVAAELEAAREIQAQMVPNSPPQIGGYTIQAAYHPALEVGGDFYQVLGHADGSATIALGDVSGKGLRAAMTVSAVVGALRTTPAAGPADILKALNRALTGQQSGSFVTCCVVRVTTDGEVTAANAGHLAPYRNGAEVVLQPNLPLGIALDVPYCETRFALEPGDTLVILSDGVVEARNAGGELFGFERTSEVSEQPAETIAQIARDFGQQDDITVLTLTRTALPPE